MMNIDDAKKKVMNDPNVVRGLREDDIAAILKEVHPLFEEEKALLKVDGSVAFVGDIHGDFMTTKAIIRRFIDCDHLVFLGDYIDREPVKWGSLFTMTYLFLLKCCFPQKILLLKGNHECHTLIPCCPYDFEEEIFLKFGSSALHKRFVEVFSVMPLMVMAHKVFAAHGGIIKGAELHYLENIGKNDVTALESLVWSDPAITHMYRGVGYRFDENDLLRFLETIHANVFVRGHDYDVLGFSIYDDRCLTLFSSRAYKDMGNTGVLIACAEKEILKMADLHVYDFSFGQWKKYQVARI